jgi:hypothetical protein
MRKQAVVSADMATKDRRLMLRLEAELAERIEAYAARMRAETGLDVTTAAAMRRLLIAGLDALEKKRGRGA